LHAAVIELQQEQCKMFSKPTVLPLSRISYTAMGLLKLRTTEAKPTNITRP